MITCLRVRLNIQMPLLVVELHRFLISVLDRCVWLASRLVRFTTNEIAPWYGCTWCRVGQPGRLIEEKDDLTCQESNPVRPACSPVTITKYQP
jgi:hypothetical protein